jgi:hypothetical protein
LSSDDGILKVSGQACYTHVNDTKDGYYISLNSLSEGKTLCKLVKLKNGSWCVDSTELPVSFAPVVNFTPELMALLDSLIRNSK